MTGRLRTYDPLLKDCRQLQRLAEPEDPHEHSPMTLLLVAAATAVLVVLGWAAWTVEAGAGARRDLSNRGGGMPAMQPVEAGSGGSLRGLISPRATEIPRAGGEESGVGRTWGPPCRFI